MVQGKINKGRYINNPAGRNSIQTEQCHLHHPPIFYGPDALPAANQQCQSTEGNQCNATGTLPQKDGG